MQDGCDYVKLQGGSVEQMTGSDVLPFIEAGISHYRAPLFYTQDNQWKMVFTNECQDYPDGSMDIMWMLAKYLTLISAILGGSLALFLWFTTCMTFSVRTWRFCAVEGILAAILRAGSFLYFGSSICTGNDSHCELAFGSQMDIVGVVLYLFSALAILGHYPDPKLRKLTDEEIIQSVIETENLQPKRLHAVTAQSKPPSSRNLAGGESNRYLDEPSYYGGDKRSVPSQSFYNKNSQYADDQSMTSRSFYSNGPQSAQYADDQSMASRSHFSKGAQSAQYAYADDQSMASKSHFSKGAQSAQYAYTDDQSMASKSFSKGPQSDQYAYADDDAYSVASQSYYSVSKDNGGFV